MENLANLTFRSIVDQFNSYTKNELCIFGIALCSLAIAGCVGKIICECNKIMQIQSTITQKKEKIDYYLDERSEKLDNIEKTFTAISSNIERVECCIKNYEEKLDLIKINQTYTTVDLIEICRRNDKEYFGYFEMTYLCIGRAVANFVKGSIALLSFSRKTISHYFKRVYIDLNGALVGLKGFIKGHKVGQASANQLLQDLKNNARLNLT